LAAQDGRLFFTDFSSMQKSCKRQEQTETRFRHKGGKIVTMALCSFPLKITSSPAATFQKTPLLNEDDTLMRKENPASLFQEGE
jgi:hypothetical protein